MTIVLWCEPDYSSQSGAIVCARQLEEPATLHTLTNLEEYLSPFYCSVCLAFILLWCHPFLFVYMCTFS